MQSGRSARGGGGGPAGRTPSSAAPVAGRATRTFEPPPNSATSILWTVPGTLLTVGTLIDQLWSTLTFPGAGPSGRLCISPLSRVVTSGRMPTWVRANASVLLPGVAIVLWTEATWAGWSLVFCGSERAVPSNPGHEPAGAADRVYFAGFAVTTLGVGDFVAGGASEASDGLKERAEA